jgi:hypothetical protein
MSRSDTPLSADDPRHGSVNGYTTYRCRCALCRDAWRVYFNAYLDAHPEQREKQRARSRIRAAHAARNDQP